MNLRSDILTIAASLTLAAIASAGDLAPPPGPISSAMKSLSQISPCVPLRTLPGSSQYTVVISQPGVYCLDEDLEANPGKGGVAISADNVVLDLGGFALRGGGSISNVAIIAVGQRRNITIRNGTITQFGYVTLNVGGTMRECAFQDLAIVGNIAGGLEASGVANSSFIGIRVSGQGEIGITAGDNCVIRACTVSDQFSGIAAGFGAIISDCAVYNCSSAISAFSGSTVERCSVFGQVTQFGNVKGIFAGTGSTVRACSVRGTDVGIEVDTSGRVEDCSAAHVGFRSIVLRQRAAAIGNQVSNCPVGITTRDAFGSRITVEGNTILQCTTGVRFQSIDNAAMKNVLISCATPFDSVAGNLIGTVRATPAGALTLDNLVY